MKKKKILFIMESLGIGGAEKSLLTILDMIDKEKYDINLYLFNHTGQFMKFIPDDVNLLPLPKKFGVFNLNRKFAPLNFLLRGDIRSSYHSLLWLINVLISKVKKKNIYIGWNHINYLFDDLDIEYDNFYPGYSRTLIKKNNIFYVRGYDNELIQVKNNLPDDETILEINGDLIKTNKAFYLLKWNYPVNPNCNNMDIPCEYEYRFVKLDNFTQFIDRIKTIYAESFEDEYHLYLFTDNGLHYLYYIH